MAMPYSLRSRKPISYKALHEGGPMAEGHDALATSDSELSETSQRGEREITPHLFLEEPGTENLDEFMLENQAI